MPATHYYKTTQKGFTPTVLKNIFLFHLTPIYMALFLLFFEGYGTK